LVKEDLQGMQLINFIKNRFLSLIQEEDGQDVFEYVLIIAGISVVIIAAGAIAVPGLFGSVVEALCNAIGGLEGMSSITGDCATLGGT
jgi:Flp pilus assembly pilin Flp